MNLCCLFFSEAWNQLLEQIDSRDQKLCRVVEPECLRVS